MTGGTKAMKKKKKKVTRKAITSAADAREQPSEAELAIALDHYTDPTHPEYDAEFHQEVLRRDPNFHRQIAKA